MVLKRAVFFITCSGKLMYPVKLDENYITRRLLDCKERLPFDADGVTYHQLSLFDDRRFLMGSDRLIQQIVS